MGSFRIPREWCYEKIPLFALVAGMVILRVGGARSGLDLYFQFADANGSDRRKASSPS